MTRGVLGVKVNRANDSRQRYRSNAVVGQGRVHCNCWGTRLGF